MMDTKIMMHLVGGKKAEDGYEFSDGSGEYVALSEGKTVVETALEYLAEYNSCHSDNVFEYGSLFADVRWEYDDNDKIFYAICLENGEPTGEVFKVDSIRKVSDGQRFSDGEPIDF